MTSKQICSHISTAPCDHIYLIAAMRCGAACLTFAVLLTGHQRPGSKSVMQVVSTVRSSLQARSAHGKCLCKASFATRRTPSHVSTSFQLTGGLARRCWLHYRQTCVHHTCTDWTAVMYETGRVRIQLCTSGCSFTCARSSLLVDCGLSTGRWKTSPQNSQADIVTG